MNKSIRLFKYLLFSLTLVIILLVVTKFRAFVIDPWDTKLFDEIYYFKQLEAVVKYGSPIGYFGYECTTAPIGGFAVWSPFIIYFYSIFYYIINNPISSYILNIGMVVLSYFFLFNYNKMSDKECALYSIPMLSLMFIRYCWSGMIEAFFYAIVIILFSLYLNNKKNPKNINNTMALIIILIAKIIRPYMFILCLFFINDKDLIKRVLKLFIFTIVSIGLFYFFSKIFSADSSFNRLSAATSGLTNGFNQGLLVGIKDFISYILYSIIYHFSWIIKNIGPYSMNSYLANYGMAIVYVGYMFNILLFLLFFFLVNDKDVKFDIIKILLLSVCTFLAVIILNDDCQAGGRHLFITQIFMWLFLIYIIQFVNNNRIRNTWYIITLLFVVLQSFLFYQDKFYRWQFTDNSIYEDSNIANYIQIGDNKENNTIIYEVNYEYFDNFHIMRNIPEGMGIQVFTEYSLLDNNNYKFRYAIICKGSPIVETFNNSNCYNKVYENDYIILYDKNKN